MGCRTTNQVPGALKCLAQEKRERKIRILEAIEVYREFGTSDEDIIQKILKKFDVTKDYVFPLLNQKSEVS